MTEQALTDVNVLDLTQCIAGPFCTKFLADFGADVVKVEKPGSGDEARMMPPFAGDDPNSEKSTVFLNLNTNKKSITLNLSTKQGVDIILKLIKDVDIVVENFAPGTMDSMGLSYETLKKENPRLIMISISGFGQEGPYRDYKATNLIAAAMGGSMSLIGNENRSPVIYGSSHGTSFSEQAAGIYGFMSALVALNQRDTTGEGQFIDVSLMESVSSILECATMIYAYQGTIRGKSEYSKFIYGHPMGTFQCKDGDAVIMPGLGGMPLLAILMGHPEYAEVPLFKKHLMRQENSAEFDKEFMLPWISQQSKFEVTEQAQELRLPFDVVQTTADIFEDPHLKARDFLAEIDHPEAGAATYPGAPFKISETPWKAGRAPLLGEHNEDIYSSRLGYTKEELEGLKTEGVI